MINKVALAAAAVLIASPALAQVSPSAERPAMAKDAVGGNSSMPAKPVPNQGMTSGGPSTRGGAGATTGSTVATPGAPMAAPNNVSDDAAKAGNASQQAKPTTNKGNTTNGYRK